MATYVLPFSTAALPLSPAGESTGATFTSVTISHGPLMPGGIGTVLLLGVLASCGAGWLTTSPLDHGRRAAEILLDQIMFVMLGIGGLMLAVLAAGFTSVMAASAVGGFAGVGDCDTIFEIALLSYALAIPALLATLLGLWKRSRWLPGRTH